MTTGAIRFWQRVSEDLGIEVVIPFTLALPTGSALTVSALVKNFGARNGMLVDPDYGVIRPHTRALTDMGYGYSSNFGRTPEEYERHSIIEILVDWGWCGPPDKTPAWLS